LEKVEAKARGGKGRGRGGGGRKGGRVMAPEEQGREGMAEAEQGG
jgi:hypothetical protein